MLYLLAIFLPPLALLFNGQPLSAIVNLLLCLIVGVIGLVTGGAGILGFILPVAHAWVLIARKEADRRDERLLREMNRPI